MAILLRMAVKRAEEESASAIESRNEDLGLLNGLILFYSDCLVFCSTLEVIEPGMLLFPSNLRSGFPLSVLSSMRCAAEAAGST